MSYPNNYGKIVNGGLFRMPPSHIENGAVVVNTSSAAAAWRAANGWLPIEDNKPTATYGYVVKCTGYAYDSATTPTKVVVQYQVVPMSGGSASEVRDTITETDATTMTFSEKDKLLTKIATAIKAVSLAVVAMFAVSAEATTLGDLTSTNTVVTAINGGSGDVTVSPASIGAATPAYVDQQNANTRAIVQTWESFLDGSNVVFSITNYISGTYSIDTPKMRIMELREGEYREVFNSHDEIILHIGDFETNKLNVGLAAVEDRVINMVANKADHDWGKYTSAGGIAPSNAVYMTAPNTIFAGGLEYERVAVGEGTVGILTTHGAPVYTAGDEGTFKFQDDGGTNYFGFAKTDSYVIGADTDAIGVTNRLVYLSYDITMSGVPCIWYTPSITQPIVWEQLNTSDGEPIAGASHQVVWEQNPPVGKECCYINCQQSSQGFFRATVEVQGSAKFMTNMPADLSGGIICTNTATGVNGIIRPTYNGSSVIWTWSAQ